MSEMVERVARALFEMEYGSPPCNESAFHRDYDYWSASARAAIEAMREPTEEMKRVFASARPVSPKTVWHETIDAALR